MPRMVKTVLAEVSKPRTGLRYLRLNGCFLREHRGSDRGLGCFRALLQAMRTTEPKVVLWQRIKALKP